MNTVVRYRTRFFKKFFQKSSPKCRTNLGKKIGDTETKSKHEKVVKQEPSEKIITLPEKIDQILNKL